MSFNPFPKQRLIDGYLPLVMPVTVEADVIQLADGSLFAMRELQPLPWETQNPAELLSQYIQLNTLYNNIAHPSLVFHVYVCRSEADPSLYPHGQFSSPVAEEIDLAYRENLFSTTLYWNTIYLGIQICPPSQVGEIINRRRKAVSPEPNDEQRDRAENILRLLDTKLAPYRPRRLGLRDSRFSEIAEALSFAMTGVRRPIGLTDGRMGQTMFAKDVIIGRETIEYRGAGHSWYGAVFGMRRYLKPQVFGVFNDLLTAPFPFTLYQCFRFMPTNQMQSIMQRKQLAMIKAFDSARSEEVELNEAINQLGSGAFVMGDHSLALLVFAGSPDRMRDVATSAWSKFSATGATIVREGMGLEAALFSMCPGNLHLRPRCGYISSVAMIALAPFQGYPRGDNHSRWGSAAAVLRTASGEPYLLPFHTGDVGNIAIYGRTGSGKTLLLAFLLVQANRFGAKVILWDKDYGLKILTHALDGTYLELRRPTGVAPLRRLTNSPEDIQFLYKLLRGCILQINKDIHGSNWENRLYLGIQMTMQLPPEERSLAEVVSYLGISEDGAGAALQTWCWGHVNGGIIDNPEDQVDMNAWIVAFDQTDILDDDIARGPVMATLYYYSDKLIDDADRIVFAADEFWRSMQEESFSDLFNDLMKARGRKGNIVNIFITQSPRDGLNSPIAHTLREQVPTQIYFAPGDSPSATDYCEGGMGLSQREFEIVCSLPIATGDHLLRRAGMSVRAQLPFAGLNDQIALMSSNKLTAKQFDRARQQHDKLPAIIRAFHEIRKAELVA